MIKVNATVAFLLLLIWNQFNIDQEHYDYIDWKRALSQATSQIHELEACFFFFLFFFFLVTNRLKSNLLGFWELL